MSDHDHLYAFYLSERYWDKASEYSDPRSEGRRADRALLFRLGLRAEQSFAYLFDFGDELRHSINLASVSDAETLLPRPLVVEAIWRRAAAAPALWQRRGRRRSRP